MPEDLEKVNWPSGEIIDTLKRIEGKVDDCTGQISLLTRDLYGGDHSLGDVPDMKSNIAQYICGQAANKGRITVLEVTVENIMKGNAKLFSLTFGSIGILIAAVIGIGLATLK